MIIDVSPSGALKFVYQDELAELMREGAFEVERVSHVEPAPVLAPDGQRLMGWEAAIFDGPILGPFETRAQAIAAEVEWIEEHRLGKERSSAK